MSAGAYATQEQLARHRALHCASVALMSTSALSVSGSFTPPNTMNPSVVVPLLQSSGVCRRQPPEVSLMDHCDGDAGLNPSMQRQNCVDAVAELHRPNVPHSA